MRQLPDALGAASSIFRALDTDNSDTSLKMKGEG